MIKKADVLYEQAKYEVIGTGIVSTSYLQRKMGISYEKAISIINRLEKESIIGKENGAKPRKIFVKPIGGIKNWYLDKGSVEDEKLYNKAKEIAKEKGRITISTLMKELIIGYARSSMLLDMLKARGIINSKNKLK